MNDTSFKDVHFEGDVNGAITVGGLIGSMGGSGGDTNILDKSSVMAEVRAECNTSPCDSFVGGVVGTTSFGSTVGFNQLVVKLKKLRGSKILGGVVGQSLNTSIYDSIVTGLMTSSDWTDGSTNFVKGGGLVGVVENGTYQRNIVVVMKKFNRGGSDITEGTLFGFVNTNQPTCSSAATLPGRNFATFPNNYNGTTCNGDAAISLIAISDPATYTSSGTAAAFNTEYPGVS